MVVATGTGDGQAQQAAAHDVDPVVDDLVDVAQVPPADGQEAERRQGPAVGAQVELVGRDLLGQEPVIGHVVVERPDHVVAVGVRVGIAPSPLRT